MCCITLYGTRFNAFPMKQVGMANSVGLESLCDGMLFEYISMIKKIVKRSFTIYVLLHHKSRVLLCLISYDDISKLLV
jgi:hypothetical protein